MIFTIDMFFFCEKCISSSETLLPVLLIAIREIRALVTDLIDALIRIEELPDIRERRISGQWSDIMSLLSHSSSSSTYSIPESFAGNLS